MRIAIAGIEHETNTYCQGTTPARKFHIQRGNTLLRTRGQHTQAGGAIDACERLGAEPVPIFFAFAQPSGLVELQTYLDFKEEILAGLADAGELHGCMLLLHGAGVVQGLADHNGDLEGDLVSSVRELLGPDVPIAASFDLHGNITRTMTAGLNGIFACRQYPHVDLHQCANDGVELIASLADQQMHQPPQAPRIPLPQCQMVQLPLLLPTTTTFGGIGERVLQQVLDVEQQEDVINISWFHGFPYADVPHIGSSICVTGYGNQLMNIAEQVSEGLWQQRESFRVPSLTADEAVATAMAEASAESERAQDDGQPRPVVIHETSDNCGAGTPGDGTHLLRAMLKAELGERACFGFIVDPEVAQLAHQAGAGSDIKVQLGGKSDDLHGDPIECEAYVKALSDGKLVLQHMAKGAPLHLGPLARLCIQGIDVVVGSRRSQTLDREPFLAVGIAVERYQVVALKSSNHFRAGFQHLACKIVTADPPGLSTHQLAVFPRKEATTPLWPIDANAQWAPGDQP